MGLEFLIIALIVAKVLPNFFQNLFQDAAFAWRGEDPPSYRRQQERAKAKAERTKSNPDLPHRRYIRNAWADAIETAEETRERRRAKRARERQERWAAEDLADRIAVAEDEAYDLNPIEEATKETTEPSVEELLEELIPIPEPVSPEPIPEPTYPVVMEEDFQYKPLHPVPDSDPARDAQVITFPTMNTTTTEDPMSSPEIVGLKAAIAYAADSADQARKAAEGIETAISGLAAGGTTGVAIGTLRQAQEQLNMAASSFSEAHAELVRHLQVTEAYNANQGAGSKQFVTAD